MEEKYVAINKQQLDGLIEQAVNLLMPQGSNLLDLPENDVRQAFEGLCRDVLTETLTRLKSTELPHEELDSDSERESRVRSLADCALEHFARNAHNKFRVALMELLQESVSFINSIHIQRNGATDEDINQAKPTLASLQRDVLRHSILRLNNLSYRAKPDIWFNVQAENLDEFYNPIKLMLKDMSLWSFDHNAVQQALRNNIALSVAHFSNPDSSAEHLSQVSMELIWEHLDGAVKTSLLTLCSWTLMLNQQILSSKLGTDVDEVDTKQIQISKKKLKSMAEYIINMWIDGLPFDLRGAGRLPDSSTHNLVKGERLRRELIALAKQLTAQGEKITWETLAALRKRPANAPQSGDALRKEAAAIGIHLNDLETEIN